MTKLNLKNLWKIAKTNNQPLLGTSTDLATLDFMEEYLETYEAFDRDIARNRGFFSPTWNLGDEDTDAEVFQQWQKDVYYYLLKNKENYTRLFNLLSIEYEPLQNYDKHSYIETIEDGQDVLTDNIGARHSEDDMAQRQDTNAYGATSESHTKGQRQDTTTHGQITVTDSFGAVSETDTIGAVSNSDVHGAENTTSENEVAGFNSSGYVDSDKNTTNKGSVTDSHTEASRTNGHSETAHSDTHTTGQNDDSFTEGQQIDSSSALAHTDTLTQGAHLDKHDERAATDSHTTDYGKTVGVDEHKFGNLGVTTSQQMALSEIDLWNNFKFYDILFGDIVKELCTFYDEGYDCF